MNKAHNNNWIFLFDFFPCLLLAFSTPSWDEPPPRSPPVHNPSIVVCCIDKHTPVSSILFFFFSISSSFFFNFLLLLHHHLPSSSYFSSSSISIPPSPPLALRTQSIQIQIYSIWALNYMYCASECARPPPQPLPPPPHHLRCCCSRRRLFNAFHISLSLSCVSAMEMPHNAAAAAAGP